MRDLFEDIFTNQPLDPMEAARRGARPQLRRRFYTEAAVAEEGGAFGVHLDGRPVRTPARRTLAAPARGLAEALAQEWREQKGAIDPATMPLTRLANSIIDGVADNPTAVARELEQYLGTDLVFYRASEPEGLKTWQAKAWDPVLDWARDDLGAAFVTGEGLVFVAQPESALAAVNSTLPRDSTNARDIWRLGALHSITTLTGSALIALAVAAGRLSVDAAWAAAHVDEDWTMERWGRDELALKRRAYRLGEMRAACLVLASL